MKRLFRKVFMTIVGALMTSSAALAGNDKPIEVNQLPAPAQYVVNHDFSGRRVAMAKSADGLFYKGYDVVFTNGDKVEFDRHGEWKDITCRHSSVPASVVPQAVRTYLHSYYPNAKVLEIEKDGSGYEVTLSNGLTITFNKDFKVIDIDD